MAAAGLWASKPADSATAKADYIFLEAADAFSDGRLDDYYYLLRRAAALAPSDTFIAAKLAEIEIHLPGADSLMQQKSYDALKARYEADPTNDFYANSFAAIAGRAGKIDDVIEVWQALDSLQPQRSEPALNLASALLVKYTRTLDTTYYTRALALYDRLESRLGPTSELTFRKVNAYLQRSDTAAILLAVDRLDAAAPADVPAQLLIGNIYEHLSMPDSALASYNRAAAIDPENGAVYLSRAEFFRNRGDSVAYDREVFRALESQELEFGQKLELLHGYVQKLYTDTLQWPRINEMFALLQELNPGESQLHDFYGNYLSALGQKEEAVEQLSYGLDLDPSDPNRWSDLVITYFELSRPDKALETARKATALYPESGRFQFFEASALMAQGQIEEALTALAPLDTIVIPDNNFRSAVYSTRGDIYTKLDKRDLAQEQYYKAVEANPENYMAMNNWAYFNAEQGIELDKAELYASIACAAEPENATSLDTYAWVMFKKKDYDKARELIDRALEAGEADEEGNALSVEIYDHAGDIYFMVHEPTKAVEYWKEALKLDPDNELIKKKVKQRNCFPED